MSKLEELEEKYKLAYVIRDDGSYGGWRTELLVEEITGEIEAKFLLCSCCRGMLREACFYKKDGKHEVACSLCIPKDVKKQNASMNRETIKEKKVSYLFFEYFKCAIASQKLSLTRCIHANRPVLSLFY